MYSVIIRMHYYICPYCAPCAEATLIKVKSKMMKCKYDKEEDCGEKHKCKEILKCKRCKEEWTINKQFLRDQKRKIKDG